MCALKFFVFRFEVNADFGWKGLGFKATRHFSTTSPERGFGNGNAEYKKRKARIDYYIGRAAKAEASQVVVEPASSSSHNEAEEFAILDRFDSLSIRSPSSSQSVVVVESPSKAKTITKYLGSGFTVLPSYGHVRDLAPRAGSVRPDDDFNMLWEVPGTARPHINAIKAALKGYVPPLLFCGFIKLGASELIWGCVTSVKQLRLFGPRLRVPFCTESCGVQVTVLFMC